MMRSRGAVLFARLGSTQSDLADRLDVSTGIVAMWQSGQRVPKLPNRKLLLDRFKIPIESWDQEPETPITPPPGSSRPPTQWGSPTVLSRIETLERIVDETLAQVEDDGAVTLLERSKVMSLLGRTLGELRRMKGEEVAEIRVVRHPKWLAMREAIVAALSAHPEALAAVVESLEAEERKTA